jgi:hypothetical protein
MGQLLCFGVQLTSDASLLGCMKVIALASFPRVNAVGGARDVETARELIVDSYAV